MSKGKSETSESSSLEGDRQGVAASPEQVDQRDKEQTEVEWRNEAQGLNKDGTKKG